jgi:antitoxin (DNA-binding transcriptional repressor) of toxin-antitoxin stability system
MKILGVLTPFLLSILSFVPLTVRSQAVAKIVTDRESSPSSILNDRSLGKKGKMKNTIPSELRPPNNERLSFYFYSISQKSKVKSQKSRSVPSR